MEELEGVDKGAGDVQVGVRGQEFGVWQLHGGTAGAHCQE